MISQYIGPIGSGKSYHALEDVYNHLKKGLYVIANFPLKFTEGMKRKGYADRFLYLPDVFLEDESGVAVLMNLSKKYGFNEFTNLCLVVLDEAGGIFPPEESTSDVQKMWKDFFKQSRKMGFDFILIMQDEKEINRTITSCMEYKVVLRKANNIFPFSLLPFTIFMHIVYWKQSRTRLSSGSTIFVKKFSELYDTHQLFGKLKKIEFPDLSKYDFNLSFGNCAGVGVSGGDPFGEGSLHADQPQIEEQLQKQPKNYAEYVTMSEEEYDLLIESLGEEKTLDMIEALNLWKGAKGRKTNSDYMTILNWVRREKKRKVVWN